MYDFLILGGGVIGLSIAWELACRGQQVMVVDRATLGGGASWAGGGILPPPQPLAGHDPLEQLRTLSHGLHPEWSARLQQSTGIDNELRRCGGIYLARRPAEAVSLRVAMQQAQRDGVHVEALTPDELVRYEPALHDVAQDQVQVAFRLPDEMQLRSPRHLRALRMACERGGVALRTDLSVQGIQVDNNRAAAFVTSADRLQAANYCLASGAWTAELLEPLGWHLPVEPWRGQMILWKTPKPLLSHVVNEGYRYLIPRDDGHLVVGATVEDVGFDCRTTEDAVNELRDFSRQMIPALRNQQMVKGWAGLRPKTADGMPFMGAVPGIENLFVAAGHYRSGLHLGPATAVVMSQLMLGEKTEVDLGPFRLNR